jgi:hypothetical protein
VGKMSCQDRQALNIQIMERAAITSHKSPLSPDGCRPARSAGAGAGPRAATDARACTGDMRLRGIPPGHRRRVYGGHVGSVRDGHRPVIRAAANATACAGRPATAPARTTRETGTARPALQATGVSCQVPGTRCRAFGRGQGAYFTAAGRGYGENPGLPGYHGVRAAQTRRTCK